MSFSICASNPWLRFNGSWLPHQPTLPAVQQHPQTRNLPPPQRTLFMAPADANPQAVSSFTSSTAPTRPADASSNSTTAGGWRTKPARTAVVSRKSQPSDAAPAAAESPPAHVPHEFTAPSTPGYASGDTAVHRLEKARGNHKKAFLLSLFFIPLPFSHYGQRVLVKSMYLSVQPHSCQVGIGFYRLSFGQIGAKDQILNKSVIKPGRWLSDQISYCRFIISIQPRVCPVKASQSYMEFQRKKRVLTNRAMLYKGKTTLYRTSHPTGKYKHTNIMAFATDKS